MGGPGVGWDSHMFSRVMAVGKEATLTQDGECPVTSGKQPRVS